jgi:hypothetical protein
MSNNTNTGHKKKIYLQVFYVLSFLVIIWFLFDGFSFYKTAYNQRPRHEDYRLLRPAGDFGHGVGIIGTLMMLFMLLYSVRKRTKFFRAWGHLSNWLDIHIYFGIIGPLLIIIHTSFKVQGLVAVSFWSMMAVAVSGILGRYLYLQIPRTDYGDELSDNQLKEILSNAPDIELTAESVSSEKFAEIEKEFTIGADDHIGIIRAVFLSIVTDLKNRFRKGSIIKKYSAEFNLKHSIAKEIVAAAQKRAQLKRRIIYLNQIQSLFHYWHVFHKPFAIIMYMIMLVHVGIAVWLGYRWIF